VSNALSYRQARRGATKIDVQFLGSLPTSTAAKGLAKPAAGMLWNSHFRLMDSTYAGVFEGVDDNTMLFANGAFGRTYCGSLGDMLDDDDGAPASTAHAIDVSSGGTGPYMVLRIVSSEVQIPRLSKAILAPGWTPSENYSTAWGFGALDSSVVRQSGGLSSYWKRTTRKMNMQWNKTLDASDALILDSLVRGLQQADTGTGTALDILTDTLRGARNQPYPSDGAHMFMGMVDPLYMLDAIGASKELVQNSYLSPGAVYGALQVKVPQLARVADERYSVGATFTEAPWPD
ncbi:hypothetical protein LCGC14_3001970, partial [marine sediment metagenome]